MEEILKNKEELRNLPKEELRMLRTNRLPHRRPPFSGPRPVYSSTLHSLGVAGRNREGRSRVFPALLARSQISGPGSSRRMESLCLPSVLFAPTSDRPRLSWILPWTGQSFLFSTHLWVQPADLSPSSPPPLLSLLGFCFSPPLSWCQDAWSFPRKFPPILASLETEVLHL